MEYGKSNRFPINGSDFMGAIFVCNKLTKDECFKKNLFGLHSKHSNFVKLVKAGMILFLFEPEERKLYGVFQATSDGAVNIVPSAFSISEKHFPAQVRFERLYTCRPLSENEFCEAIEENYFTPTTLTFALSSQQVCRLIWLFSLKCGFPHDQFPGGIQSEFMKIYENSNLARTGETGNEKLLKFDPAGYNMDNNNIQSTRNTVSSGYSKNHLTSYLNHDLHDITLQNHIIRRQYEPYLTVSHTAEPSQPDQVLPIPSYDPSRESSSYCSSSRPLHKQPSFYLDMDHPYLGEKKFNFCTDSSLEAEASHMRNQSYSSASQLGTKYFTLTKYSGVDISELSPISKPSRTTSHSLVDHINLHDFNQNDFPDGSHPPSGRFHTMAPPSIFLGNPGAYSRQTQQEDGSLSCQDWPSSPLPDYRPILKGETLVNSSYNPVLKDEMVNDKEAFKYLPCTNKYDYHSDFTCDTNRTVKDSFDLICNYKSRTSDSSKFSHSDTIQKKCSVFRRLSRSSKELKHSSLDHMPEFLNRRKNAWTKVNRKPEILKTFKTDVSQLDNMSETGLFENDSLTEKKLQNEEFGESNGFLFPNFKRRSAVKRQNTGARDLGKCKRRKIIRPSFNEEDDSSQFKNISQNHIFQHGEGLESVGSLGLPLSNLPGERGESSTNSSTLDIRGSQRELDCQSKVSEKLPVDLVVRASEKINSYSTMYENHVDGKLVDNSCDWPLDSSSLPVEEQQKVTNNSGKASVSDGLPEKDSSANTDTNHLTVVKMDAQGFPLGIIRCQTETSDLAGGCSNIISDAFTETDSTCRC